MKLFKQTIFSDPDKKIVGNCFQTCVAILTGKTVDEVPHFYSEEHPVISFHLWLDENGYKAIEFNASGASHWIQSDYWGYHMITGPSPRGRTMHAVIGLNGDVYFDVHPDNQLLLDGDWIYTFIIKK